MKSVETNTAVLEQMQRFQNLRIPRIPFSDEALRIPFSDEAFANANCKGEVSVDVTLTSPSRPD